MNWYKAIQTILLLYLLIPSTLFSQLISVKTIPIAEGNQFQLFPSKNQGMGGVSIAVDDEWLDLFKNPARGSRIKGTLLFSSPAFYNVTGPGASAVSLPVGILNHSHEWFGGAGAALQQLTPFSNELSGVIPLNASNSAAALSEKASPNAYLWGVLGKTVGDVWSIGCNMLLADLNALEGVDLLYARSRKINQDGNLIDLRAGLSGNLSESQTLDAVFLHRRLNMTHEVYSESWQSTIVEKNKDRNRTWGIHTRYTQLSPNGWRWGGIVTANYKSHPKIPNYELMNIPRDPGHSWAFNLGLGTSRTIDKPSEAVTYAVDIVYEPIWSDTWAEAIDYIVNDNGEVMPPGGKTIENGFRFSNYILRTGVTRETESRAVHFGLQARNISYRLQQTDNVQLTQRSQKESWMEWNVYWGLSFKHSEFEIRYAGQLGFGTGRPGVEQTVISAAMAGGDYLLAPSGPLTLDSEVLFFSQITFSVSLGK